MSPVRTRYPAPTQVPESPTVPSSRRQAPSHPPARRVESGQKSRRIRHRRGRGGGDGSDRLGVGRRFRGLEAHQLVQLAVQVLRIEVRVALRHARVAVTHDPLHEPGVRAAHRQQAARRVAKVVEPNRPHHRRDPELVVVAGVARERRREQRRRTGLGQRAQ